MTRGGGTGDCAAGAGEAGQEVRMKGTPPVHSNSSRSWNKSEVMDGAQASASIKEEGPTDSWGKAATSVWGSGSGKEGW
ncbi:hypothetical protein C2S52_002846 [Perilla frutescens var. hirtella]|nr:hypothetical protein C2S52_002846 [Perilla frutescens var. hirtella]